MFNLIFDGFKPFFDTFLFYSQQYLDRYTFLVPLGFIGIWRWSVWMMKEVVGVHYHPKTKPYHGKVSIVVPVYNEDTKIFTKALASWKENNPTEIIAVIDHTDEKCIEIFEEFKKTFRGAVLIVTKIPGKRQALADGIKVAKSEIVALVDSDTIWDKDTLINGLSPFHDSKVAGVATHQSVLDPKTFAQKVFDIQLDLRYRHEYPFLAASGNALVCLSGRTAFYRKSVITPLLDDLVNEKFLGKPVISGDDKRLTYLVLGSGWKVAYQNNSRVYTPGMESLAAYLKQRLRWTRNSLRADIKALLNGWPLKHPSLFFFQVDKFLQSFVVILSPIYFLVAIYFKLWIPALVIFCWWFISRAIKIYPYLSRKPSNIFILPGYVFYSFFAGLLRIYAIFTLNTQGWITRWDKSRLPQLRFLTSIPGYVGTIGVVILLFYGVYIFKQYTYINPLIQRDELLKTALPNLIDKITGKSVLGASVIEQKDLQTKRYISQKGDTLEKIATGFGVDENQLYYANNAKMPGKTIPEGTVVSIPGKDITLDATESLINPSSSSVLTVRYEKNSNTILVSGSGVKTNLREISERTKGQYLREVEPRIWYTSATIFLYNGVSLELNNNEVEWLKLESNKDSFAMLRGIDSDIYISGVKITSWDSTKNDYDKELSDGRSFVMVKDNSRMDIYSSELAYLGYPTSSDISVSPYGVSWKLSTSKLLKVLITGEVVNSKFHDNYFGTYTYGATGMIWRGNEFYDNVRYGLDPHDDSNGFIVEDNKAFDNGSHGIIFSKRCMYNTIRNNISYNNKLHGIMLHEKSDNNIIENNTLTGNTSGVALWRSSNNIVRNNTIKENRHGIRANVSSNNNTISSNKIIGSKLYGLYFYEDANVNYVTDNNLEGNHVGIYIRSNSNEISSNILIGNNTGIYFQDEANDNKLADNQIKESGKYAIYTKVSSGVSNLLGDNDFEKNRKDIMGMNDDGYDDVVE